MSAIADLLSLPQEEVIMRNLATLMAIDYEQIHPRYFTFTYNQINDKMVAVQIDSRTTASDGSVSIWQGSHTIQVYRAELMGTARNRQLVINWADGLAMEHVIRGLRLQHSFNVTLSELEFLDPLTGQWGALADDYQPAWTSTSCRFSEHQGRIVPSTSEFTLTLAKTARADLGEYLRLISAGSVVGGVA